jgi:hypothetical protein
MFAVSRDEAIPREKATIRAQKVMLTILFNRVSLVILNTLSSGTRFNQEYLIYNTPLDIVEARELFFHRFRWREFVCIWTILWSQGDRWTWQFEVWPRSSPTLFARPEFMQLLAVWNIKVENQGSGVSMHSCYFTKHRTSWLWKTSSPSFSIELNDLKGSWSIRENTTQIDIKRSSESLWHGEIWEVGNLFYILYTGCPET